MSCSFWIVFTVPQWTLLWFWKHVLAPHVFEVLMIWLLFCSNHTYLSLHHIYHLIFYFFWLFTRCWSSFLNFYLPLLIRLSPLFFALQLFFIFLLNSFRDSSVFFIYLYLLCSAFELPSSSLFTYKDSSLVMPEKSWKHFRLICHSKINSYRTVKNELWWKNVS